MKLELSVVLITFIVVTFLLSFFVLGIFRGSLIMGNMVETGLSLEGGKAEFVEKIDANDEIISKSVDANNFVKRCFGIALILFVIFLFYKEERKKK